MSGPHEQQGREESCKVGTKRLTRGTRETMSSDVNGEGTEKSRSRDTTLSPDTWHMRLKSERRDTRVWRKGRVGTREGASAAPFLSSPADPSPAPSFPSGK
jgi:hypothetical protein